MFQSIKMTNMYSNWSIQLSLLLWPPTFTSSKKPQLQTNKQTNKKVDNETEILKNVELIAWKKSDKVDNKIYKQKDKNVEL